MCNLQHGICLEYFPSASECKLKTFISIYFHWLIYTQAIGICMYIMLQIKPYKQGHAGIHRATKARNASPGLTFLTRKHKTVAQCTTRRAPGLLHQKHSEEQKTSEWGSNTFKIAFLKGLAEPMQAVTRSRLLTLTWLFSSGPWTMPRTFLSAVTNDTRISR